MGVFENFPYTNFHELNFDWILNKIRELENIIETHIIDPVARALATQNAQDISNLTTTVTNLSNTVSSNKTLAHNEATAAQTTADNALATANATKAIINPELGNVASGYTKTFQVSNNARMVLFMIGSVAGRCAQYHILVTSGGTVDIYPIYAANASIVIESTTQNEFTVTNNYPGAGNYVYIEAITYNGTITAV